MIINILRGSHEIGGSCVEIEGKEGSRILIDIGQPLVDTERCLVEPPSDLDGVLISHAHQDHYGLLTRISPTIPVYVSAPTKQLIDITARFTGSDFSIKKPVIFYSFKPFFCGEFKITPYLVDHSAFDAHSFLIEDGANRIFYSGDFRGHGRKAALLNHFEQYPPKKMDALLLEGTMLGRYKEKIVNETELEEEIVDKLLAANFAAFVCVSGQNIDRLVTLYRACARTNRKFVVDPYTGYVMREMNAFNSRLPYPSIEYAHSLRVYYPNRLCRRMRNHLAMGKVLNEFDDFRVKPMEICQHPNHYLVLVRDTMIEEVSQAFGQSAERALFLYSLWRGYWEEAKMAKLRNWVIERNMEQVYAHTSGHAYPTALRRLAEAINPRMIIPIHTNCPDDYSNFFTQPIQLANDGVKIIID